MAAANLKQNSKNERQTMSAPPGRPTLSQSKHTSSASRTSWATRLLQAPSLYWLQDATSTSYASIVDVQARILEELVVSSVHGLFARYIDELGFTTKPGSARE
eukprot:6848809-Prymnesium_polylepis.1